MDLNILGFGRLGDEDVRKNDGENKENNDDYQALTQPAFGATHPFDAAIFSFLGVTCCTLRTMMILRHVYFRIL